MLYFYFLAFHALEMMFETWISARHSRELIRRGAIEIAPLLLPLMAMIYLLMFGGSVIEFQQRQPEISPIWISIWLGVFLVAKMLKFWAVTSLGNFWTMRVLIVPGTKVITHGPYRYIRHPNYVAVILELAATPLLGKCFLTFGVTIVLFLSVLIFRIRHEEAALRKYTNFGL